MISTIIFDLNNTLVGIRVDDPERRYDHVLGVSKETFFQAAFKYWQEYEVGKYRQAVYLDKISTNLGLSHERIPLILHLLSDDVYIIDGMDEILKELFGRFRLLLLAGDGEELVYTKLKKFNLVRYFASIYCTCFEGMHKDNLQIYRNVLNKEQISATSCLYIDDRSDFVRLAIEAGMNGIVFNNSNQLRNDLRNFSISLRK